MQKRSINKFLFVILTFLIIAIIISSFERLYPTPSLDRNSIELSDWEFISVEGMSAQQIQDIINEKSHPEWISYKAPGIPKLDTNVSRFVVRTKLPDKKIADPAILLEMYDHLFTAYQNGEPIYSFGVIDGYFVNDTLGNPVCFIELSENYENQWIYFDSISKLSTSTGYIKQATFSSKSQHILAISREGFPRFSISILLITMGFVFMIFYRNKERTSFLQVGLLSVSIGMWFLFDSNRSLALLPVNPLLAQTLGLISLYIAPIFFGLFIRDSFKDNSWTSKLVNFWIYVTLISAIIAITLDLFFKIRLIKTLAFFHGIVLVWVILCFIRVVYICHKKQEGAKILALACGILAITATVEIFGFVFHLPFLQTGYVSYAMIAFIATLVYLPVKKVANLNKQVYEYSVEITKNSETLEKIILALSYVLERQNRESLIFEILDQLINIINVDTLKSEISSVVSLLNEDDWDCISTTGSCTENDANDYIAQYKGKERMLFKDGTLVVYFTFENKLECVIIVKNIKEMSKNAKRFVEIYLTCVYAAYNNLRLNREIINSQENIIYALGNVTESRSHNTGQHINRVAEYSKYLALQFGMDEKEADLIKIASAMHDIGKLGIPDEILNKPAKLTQEEYELMKQHSQIGHEVLLGGSGEILRASAIIALEHHEKYNGHGYPYNLAGEDINIYARIVAIADVFDALMSERPYKKAWSIEKVIEYFKEESGKQFDPKLVEIFLSKIDTFLDIQKSSPDN